MLLPVSLLLGLAALVPSGALASASLDIDEIGYAHLEARRAARAGRAPVSSLDARALPNNPSGNYTPAIVDCPSTRPAARTASNISSEESEWLKLRRNNTLEPLIAFLETANISNFNASSYIRSASTANVPNIGLAISGGGYRALLNGAGFLAAADSRTPNQTTNGSISGLLQSATYLAGLSGGGWLVGSIYANNFTSVSTMRDGYEDSDLWRFDNSIFSGPSSDADENGSNETATSKAKRGIITTVEYWTDVYDDVGAKADAGWSTSITDYWGRALSYQLINADDGGPDYTFSSIALTDPFKSGEAPFPILVADSRAPGDTVIALNSTVFEFNPYEMGSWDPTTYGFVPTEYLGSNFSNGVVSNSSSARCVRGFDQFGYVMGTSSTLFNQFLLTNLSAETDIPSFLISAIDDVLEKIGSESNDIAQYVPNPFLKYRPSTNPSANNTQLSLVDGGEDLQNIPLHPLIQPFRAVDIIIAVDSSADTDYVWPNGTALRATYDRQFGDIANGTLFPSIPDADTFINEKLNQRPTFFGCDASNFTLSDGQTAPPIVVYLANAPYSFQSNYTTFTDSYTLDERNSMIENGFNMGTQGNGTVNSDWPTCLSCAILSRSFTRTGTTVPSACTSCFTKYCWNGTINSTSYGAYDPAYLIDGAADAASAAGRSIASSSLWSVAVASFASLLVVMFL